MVARESRTMPGGDAMAARLLAWYDRHARRLPWRVPPGRRATDTPDPYKVWLSEIMLQQTTVATVGPYFAAFVARWPTVEALADAPREEVLSAWAGLGYYARARNLHACAQTVAGRHGGRFPETEEELRKLPGIGPYTAAAVAAIAFDRAATPVDGNVERVVARLFAVETPLPAAKPELKSLARDLTPAERPGDFAQALMDLGATVCLPRTPKCPLCPLSGTCRAHARGIAAELPARAAKKARPTRRAVAFWVLDPDGRVLLRSRPDDGLLGGMMEVPSTPWRESSPKQDEIAAAAPVRADWTPLAGSVRHTFTHFHFEMSVVAASLGDRQRARAAARAAGGDWYRLDDLGTLALPTVMRKVIAHAMKAESLETRV
jgi:A/G-specific adenine glycosylase